MPEIPWWVLLLWLCCVYFLLFYGELIWSELEDIRNPHLGGETRTVSCAPTLFLPVPMLGVALLLESANGWGTELVVGLHAVLAVFIVGSIIRYKRQIRILKRSNGKHH